MITIIQTPLSPRAYVSPLPVPGVRKNMKIAQIAPLMESVPPRLYGGTERIVSYLTDELVRLGHEVTLFASADSVTAAKLVSCASARMATGYVALYHSLLRRPSISERETSVPLRRPGMERKLNGQAIERAAMPNSRIAWFGFGTRLNRDKESSDRKELLHCPRAASMELRQKGSFASANANVVAFLPSIRR